MQKFVTGVKEQAGCKTVLDTNILQYLKSSTFLSGLKDFVSALVDSGNTLKISEVSVLELLSGCTPMQEATSLSILGQFERYSIDAKILTVAARLQNIYRSLEVESGQISMGDKIIAATAIVMGTDILTANVNDFPRPLFKEKHEELFLFKKGYKTCLQVVQILSPNWELVESYLTDEG